MREVREFSYLCDTAFKDQVTSEIVRFIDIIAPRVKLRCGACCVICR